MQQHYRPSTPYYIYEAEIIRKLSILYTSCPLFMPTKKICDELQFFFEKKHHYLAPYERNS